MIVSISNILKTIGKLATNEVADGKILSGILIEKDFHHHIVDPTDLTSYTQLNMSTVTQRLFIPSNQSPSDVYSTIQLIYENVKETTVNNKTILVVTDIISLSFPGDDHIIIEWASDPVNDMIADSIISLLMQPKFLPNMNNSTTKKESTTPTTTTATKTSKQVSSLVTLLQLEYGNATYDNTKNNINIDIDGNIVNIDLSTKEVKCEHPHVLERVTPFASRVMSAVFPLKSQVEQ